MALDGCLSALDLGVAEIGGGGEEMNWHWPLTHGGENGYDVDRNGTERGNDDEVHCDDVCQCQCCFQTECQTLQMMYWRLMLCLLQLHPQWLHSLPFLSTPC